MTSMMHNFAIIGLGRFGECVLECLAQRDMHVIVIDSDDAKVQRVRDIATQAVKADAMNYDLFDELFPDGIDCAIVDMGDQMERSILVTNHLAKLKVNHIIVEAVNPHHAEILRIVGATKVVFPEMEAAERLAGMLAGRGSLDFFPVGEDFSMIEIEVPDKWVKKTVVELDLRNKFRINVVAIRRRVEPGQPENWRLPDGKDRLSPDDILLLVGRDEDLQKARSR
jgi:trk system potassium uptake protein TrkA